MASVQGLSRECIEPPRVPDRVYREQDIALQFGDAFDQVKASEGYADDGESQSYRFLEHWYLIKRDDTSDTNNADKSTCASTSTSTSFKRRLPLPSNYLFSQSHKDCIIAGWLQPLRSSSSSGSEPEQQQSQPQQEAIFVELTEMEFCSFDRSKLYRGYWIHTQEALYWLRQPDTATSTCASTDIATSPEQVLSQEQVHLPARAQLAVLSTVLDHVILRPDASIWAKKTVTQVHKEWKPAQHADEDSNVNFNVNVNEPFNKGLLAKYKAFVVQHLLDPGSRIPFHPAYTAKSAFIKSLKVMSNSSKSAVAVVTPAQLLAWTLESEAASQQYPWGESTVPVDPALGDSLEPTLSDSYDGVDGDMTTSMNWQLVQDSEENINAAKKNDYGSNGNGDSRMISIKLVVEGAPLSALLNLPIVNDYKCYRGNKNGTGDNSNDEVKDELDGGGDSGDERYQEATIGKRLKKLSKPKFKAEVTKKHAASSHDAKKRPIKKAKVTNFEIPDGLWSPYRMAEALLEIGDYLDPRPKPSSSYSSWESVQNYDFLIADEVKAKELLLGIENWKVHITSLECLLMVTESFGNSCRWNNDLVAKKLVSLAKSRYAIIIFDDWRRWAAFLLQERLDTKKPVQNTPELYLLISILNLITDCVVVKSAKNLDALKERGLDWERGIQEIYLLCVNLQNHNLSLAYDRAKSRLELLRKNTTVGNTESSLLVVVPRKTASSPEASPSKSESSLLGKVPRRKAPSPEASPSKSEPSLLGKVPRKTASSPEASPSNSEPSLLDKVPRRKAPSPEAFPSKAESFLLAKVPRKTAPVPPKLPSEQDETPKEEPSVESTSSSLPDTDTPARSSWGIAPKTDGLNIGSRNADTGLPWGGTSKTESTSPRTPWEPTMMGIQAGWSSKMSDTSPFSASVKDDPGERARSSTIEKIMASPERCYDASGAVAPTRELSGAVDHSNDAKTHKETHSLNGATVAYSQITSGLRRGRRRALPFWMAKREIQDDSSDSRRATKEISTNLPAWMTSDAPKKGSESTQTDVSRTGVNGKCCSTLLASVSNDSSWDTSRELKNRSSYPSALKERDNFSVFPSASGSYRSVRPA